MPFTKYDDPVVEAEIEQRRKFLEAKRDDLFRVEILQCMWILEHERRTQG